MRGRHNADRSAYVAIGLLAVSLLLMTFDVRSSREGFGAVVRSSAQLFVLPIQTGVNAVVTPILDFSDAIANLAGLREENDRLRVRIGTLEREVVRVGHLEAEAEELKTLLGLRLEDDLYGLAIPAEVIGRGGTLDPTLIIDRGTVDGVHAGQPVVDGQGALVGVVSQASENGATVTPITSRRAAAVTVRLADGQRGVVEGLGAGMLQLSILEADNPVSRGELLVTFGPFGDSDAYPKGLEVGTVVASAYPQYGVARVGVDPIGDVERLEYVAVIPWPPSPDSVEGDLIGVTTLPVDSAESGPSEPASEQEGT